jgi:hypothetical protein
MEQMSGVGCQPRRWLEKQPVRPIKKLLSHAKAQRKLIISTVSLCVLCALSANSSEAGVEK